MELTDIHARTIVVDAISHDGKSLKAIRVSDKAEYHRRSDPLWLSSVTGMVCVSQLA